MTSGKNLWVKLLPAFFAFIIMGFVDIIGVSTEYIKQDFELSSFTAQFLPMMVLLWFFILSVPAGVLQDKLGKKKMLMIGMVIQALGLGLPFLHYSFPMMFASFILLGIGNTIIQVSANPLLQDVAPADKLASFLSSSQFVKAVISFAGPLIAAFMASKFGNWRLVLGVYGITSILGAIWLMLTPIAESKPERKPATFASCFGLLKNRFVALMALSIFLVVGVEVATNTNIANVLISKYGISLEKAAWGISAFFAGETISRLIGAIILNWIKPRVFLFITALTSLAGVAGIYFSPGFTIALVAIFVIGLGTGNMFPLVFSLSLEKLPDRANEISGLLIMAVSGGAFIPLLMGLISTLVSPLAGVFVIGACMTYILWLSIYVRKN